MNTEVKSVFIKKQEELLLQLEKLQQEEDPLKADINNMLNQKAFIDSKIKNVSKLLSSLKIMKHNTEDLVSTVEDISQSSEQISSKVRLLDTAKNRVNECQLRVGDLIDLEVCSAGVQEAITNSDFETGSAHVHRFLCMDQSLLKRTANDVDNVSSMLKSVRTLQEATSQLRAIVEVKFDEAVENEDLYSVERFFKIFPLLGMHEEGIKKFCEYMKIKIGAAADNNIKSALNTRSADKRYGVIFADAISLLFEGLAKSIDTHQPLIETYYGPGRLLLAVKILQSECDKQVRRLLLEWSKARQINKKIEQINEHQRMSSSSSFSKLDKLDPKELDVLIGETALIHLHCELYIKFIQRKVTADIEVGVRDPDEKLKASKDLEQFLQGSGLAQSKHEVLSNYLRFEQYFMEESFAKAISMDVVEPGQQTSSMVDDVFFIVRKCIRRSISTSSLDGICAIINNACRVLESEFCEVLRSRLRQGYPSGYLDFTHTYNVLQTTIQQGRLQSGDVEQSRTIFLVTLNNADSGIEYVDKLIDKVLKEIESALPNMNTNQRGKLESCLSGLSSANATLKDLVSYGMQQLSTTAIKPRTNLWVDEFSNHNHQLNEDELAAHDAEESFAQKLIMNLETLMSSFRDLLTPSNFDQFIQILAQEVVQRFEKVILKSSFNRLGGLVLDKEVRYLAGYMTSITSWSIREKFARLSNIATILNLESVNEIYDYWGNHDGALTWRLTPSEVRAVMSLRTDFKVDEIRRIQFK